MKVAIIGSRTLTNVDLEKYLPKNISLIISGGAKGIDTLAEIYADKHNIPKLILLPEYKKYGRNAPLKRNYLIVELADLVIAFWDGKSAGTQHSINYACTAGATIKVFNI